MNASEATKASTKVYLVKQQELVAQAFNNEQLQIDLDVIFAAVKLATQQGRFSATLTFKAYDLDRFSKKVYVHLLKGFLIQTGYANISIVPFLREKFATVDLEWPNPENFDPIHFDILEFPLER